MELVDLHSKSYAKHEEVRTECSEDRVFPACVKVQGMRPLNAACCKVKHISLRSRTSPRAFNTRTCKKTTVSLEPVNRSSKAPV